jgi:UDP-N-acetylmuramoyl-L-alanyl-D-glutamate--2,6-diaminopimelate ligase
MRFGQIIANAAQIVRGSPETEITGITCDSRRVSAGMLFCALAGVKANGSTFIQDALARGAAAVLAEREVPGDFPLAVAKEARRATALAASSFYRWPAAQLVMLSVTGTNGKTTVAYLTEEMVRTAGRRAGLIGTVEERFPGVSRPSSYTTPESIDLQALLAEMVAAKTEIVAMEVSSHALAQARVDGIRFRAAGFTQLTRDHLDYHGTMDNYFEAKALLFRHHLAQEGTAVIGTEDDWSDRLAASIASRRPWRYGIERGDLSMPGVKLSLAGFEGDLLTPAGTRRVTSRLVGRHNVLNALCATGLALAANIPLDAIVESLATTHGAPGRLERVDDPAGRRVFVDYAHTDDALARVLDALRTLSPSGSRLVTVFGCGGDRDRGKRPLMGRAAGQRSDVAIVTSDNPRTEDPAAILDEIVPGLQASGLDAVAERSAATGARGYMVVQDRTEAIRVATRVARPGDAVLIAGKGHEPYQISGTTKLPFDDRLVAKAALAGWPS